MNFTKTKIPGVVIIQPKIFGDSRGYFMETFKKADYVAAGIDREKFGSDSVAKVLHNITVVLHNKVTIYL